ncbi:MAG TPA: M48 family metalloprotease [Parafilimonas sp.]|nr:M48 family metalloprotease [Parafilimonas sp.]
MNPYNYPPSPAMVAPEKLNPSPAFRKQVAKVITAIIVFFIVYLLLVAAAVALAIACCYLGIMLIVVLPKLITLVAGLGLVAVGVSVIFFLIKFIFAVSKNENPYRIEITEQEQPELFAFIKQLSNETKTRFPKKIFISPDVNACVFYNSSFWSMLFPVRKNLEIGLGLVNSINISELKAVIAHEFGHFSQRSMKLGSFTYNVNRIIYNMLFENNSYTSFLNAWGRLHGLLSLFANITVKIAQGIQYVLREMYKVINKSYMGLSREMEFHADAVAASVAGGNNVISGLSRIELASSCYNTTLNKADAWLRDKKRMHNIFNNQLIVFRMLAARHNLPLKQGLPEISFDFITSFSTSRINYKNQWASHPELGERKAHLDALDLNVPADESSAWIIFNDPEKLQQLVTEKLYSLVHNQNDLQIADSTAFDSFYNKEAADFALPGAYKGYYDDRYVDLKEWDIDELSKHTPAMSFDDLFTETNTQLQSLINNNNADIETLKAIRDKQIDIKSFDFDGVKYQPEDCDHIIQQLEKQTAEKKEELEKLDKETFIFFNSYVSGLDIAYKELKRISENAFAYTTLVNSLLDAMQPLYKEQLTLERAGSITGQMKNEYEIKIKKEIRFLLEMGVISEERTENLYSEAVSFLNKDYVYFVNGHYMNDELSSFSNIAIQTANAYHDHRFRQFKKLLEDQLSGYQSATHQNAIIVLEAV